MALSLLLLWKIELQSSNFQLYTHFRWHDMHRGLLSWVWRADMSLCNWNSSFQLQYKWSHNFGYLKLYFCHMFICSSPVSVWCLLIFLELYCMLNSTGPRWEKVIIRSSCLIRCLLIFSRVFFSRCHVGFNWALVHVEQSCVMWITGMVSWLAVGGLLSIVPSEACTF